MQKFNKVFKPKIKKDKKLDIDILLKHIKPIAIGLDPDKYGENNWKHVILTGSLIIEMNPGINPDTLFVYSMLYNTLRRNNEFEKNTGTQASFFLSELQKRTSLLSCKTYINTIEALNYEEQNNISDIPEISVCWDATRIIKNKEKPINSYMNTLAFQTSKTEEFIHFIKQINPEKIKWEDLIKLYKNLIKSTT